MVPSVFVTGGAGYVGSHMVELLRREGYAVSVFDNLSQGHRDAVGDAELIVGDLREPSAIMDALATREYEAVIHFAGKCYVGESVREPAMYQAHNVAGMRNLLAAMRARDVRRLIFSSTCSTYGEPRQVPIVEEHPQNPVNPYGATKLAAERAMIDGAAAFGLQGIALRYFNAAGCDLDGRLGERHDPETHLIPLVLREALRIRSGGEAAHTALEVFGADYDTADGTCVRDYVHVNDLCVAHLLAMERLSCGREPGFEAFNLGSERGYSVFEVVDMCRRVTGEDIRYQLSGRRPGDPACLVADARKARTVLGWTPTLSDLESIVRTAWRWQSGQGLRSTQQV